MTTTRTISVKGRDITVSRKEREDYISLTDIARYKNPNEPIDLIKNWLRSRTTIEFIGLWEQLHNPHFKAVEFDRFMYEAGSNSFEKNFGDVRSQSALRRGAQGGDAIDDGDTLLEEAEA